MQPGLLLLALVVLASTTSGLAQPPAHAATDEPSRIGNGKEYLLLITWHGEDQAVLNARCLDCPQPYTLPTAILNAHRQQVGFLNTGTWHFSVTTSDGVVRFNKPIVPGWHTIDIWPHPDGALVLLGTPQNGIPAAPPDPQANHGM